MYACIKNFRLLIFEKAMDQDHSEKAIVSFNLKSVFLFFFFLVLKTQFLSFLK